VNRLTVRGNQPCQSAAIGYQFLLHFGFGRFQIVVDRNQLKDKIGTKGRKLGLLFFIEGIPTFIAYPSHIASLLLPSFLVVF
jgi:hypothetical protein